LGGRRTIVSDHYLVASPEDEIILVDKRMQSWKEPHESHKNKLRHEHDRRQSSSLLTSIVQRLLMPPFFKLSPRNAVTKALPILSEIVVGDKDDFLLARTRADGTGDNIHESSKGAPLVADLRSAPPGTLDSPTFPTTYQFPRGKHERNDLGIIET
jgi:hypothetical protein